MYWLQRPPYAKRVGAVLLVLAAVFWDLRESRTAAYPVAALPIAAGAAIEDDAVDWINVPFGTLSAPDLSGATAATDIEPGEPLTGSLLADPVTVPADWWTVPIEIGALSLPGDEVLLVIADPPLTVQGVVVAAQVGDPYSLDFRPAAVAVPAVAAPVVAAAEREGLLVAAVRPPVTGR